MWFFFLQSCYSKLEGPFVEDINHIYANLPKPKMVLRDSSASNYLLLIDNKKLESFEAEAKKVKYSYNVLDLQLSDNFVLINSVNSPDPSLTPFISSIILDNPMNIRKDIIALDLQSNLHNIGQNGGFANEDANVFPAWEKGYHGENVTVLIVDDGFLTSHVKVANRIVKNLSLDLSTLSTNVNATIYDYHGTPSMGVAVASNDTMCGVGVAYAAKIALHRYDSTNFTVKDYFASLNAAPNQIDISSNSWETDQDLDAHPYYYHYPELLETAVTSSIQATRNGLGRIIVFCAGNNGLNGGDANSLIWNKDRHFIIVAASSQYGAISFYSNYGHCILVNAPSSGNYQGFASSDMVPFVQSISADHDNACDQAFSGTSAATPLVSGICALMLQANNQLTWRDVQMILIITATVNDPRHFSWHTNKALYQYSEFYGFGRVDADLAVNISKTWTTLPPEKSSFAEFSGPVQIPHPTVPESKSEPQLHLMETLNLPKNSHLHQEGTFNTNDKDLLDLMAHKPNQDESISLSIKGENIQTIDMKSIETEKKTISQEKAIKGKKVNPTIKMNGDNDEGAKVTFTIEEDQVIFIESAQLTFEIDSDVDELALLILKLKSPSGTEVTFKRISPYVTGYDKTQRFGFIIRDFFGEDASGDWTLTIFSHSLIETGSLKNFKFTVFGMDTEYETPDLEKLKRKPIHSSLPRDSSGQISFTSKIACENPFTLNIDTLSENKFRTVRMTDEQFDHSMGAIGGKLDDNYTFAVPCLFKNNFSSMIIAEMPTVKASAVGSFIVSNPYFKDDEPLNQMKVLLPVNNQTINGNKGNGFAVKWVGNFEHPMEANWNQKLILRVIDMSKRKVLIHEPIWNNGNAYIEFNETFTCDNCVLTLTPNDPVQTLQTTKVIPIRIGDYPIPPTSTPTSTSTTQSTEDIHETTVSTTNKPFTASLATFVILLLLTIILAGTVVVLVIIIKRKDEKNEPAVRNDVLLDNII